MGDFDLDLLIREIGPFGKYQLINYVLLCIPILWTTMYSLAYVFTAGDLSYRCKIPACDTNELIDDPMQSSFLNFTVPKDVQSGKFSQCQQFRPINDYGCQPEDFDSSAVDTCSEFVYESGEETILSSFQLTCDQEWKLSLVGTINNIGQFVCLPLTGFISDKYGRKTVFVLGILASGIMGFIRGFSVNYPMFAVFEFLEPALGSSVYSSGFILAMEYVDPTKRVLGTSFLNIFYTLGMALLGLLAYATRQWRTLLWILYAPSIICISYFWILPESTRWLATKGKLMHVRKNISKAGKINRTEFSDAALKMLTPDEEEFMELQPKDSSESTDTATTTEATGYPILKAIRNRSILLRLVILSLCWATNTFVYYGLSIYSVSFAGDKYVNYVAGALIELPSILITYFLVEAEFLGRQRSLIITMLISGISCFCQLALEPSDAESSISVGPFILFLIGKCAITCSFVIVYIYTSELFPTELRHSLLAFCSMFGRIGSMIAPQVPLLGKYIQSLPMILFGGFAVVAGSLIIFLPETHNRVLPDRIEDAVAIDRGQGAERKTGESRDRAF